jgi:predicted unusual protein kinase regulating ubiquinone biosynthesis (AarF/ABC1/UbiB family)
MLFVKYGNKDIYKVSDETSELTETDIKEKDDESIEAFVNDLEKMGTTFIKLGQFLSTRSDMIAPEYMDALQRLQDNVKPFSTDQLQEIIQSELGLRISKGFSEFDDKPLAAASIGQVHRARLLDGRPVVVKVQRPDIREKMIKDLEVLSEIAEFLNQHTQEGKNIMLKATLDEFRKVTLRELDFLNEAQNLKILRNNLQHFEDIIVPEPIDGYTSSKVITMDHIKGKKVTSVSPLRQMEMNGSALADELFQAYLQQVLVDGFYHCDPHPGNVFLTEDNKIALLDLGMVAYMSEEMQRKLLQILISISDGRGEETASYAMDVSTKMGDYNEITFKQRISEIVSRNKNITLEKLETGRVVMEISKTAAMNGIYLPNEFTMLGKTLLNLDKIGRTLDPKFDPNEAIQRNADEILGKKIKKSTSSKRPYEVLLEAKDFFEMLPQRLNKLFDNISNNKLKVSVDAVDEKYLMAGIQKVANRITIGLVLAALIIAAALIMDIQTEIKILGYPVIAMIFFLIAAIGIIILAIQILFKDEKAEKKEDSKKVEV